MLLVELLEQVIVHLHGGHVLVLLHVHVGNVEPDVGEVGRRLAHLGEDHAGLSDVAGIE